MTARVPEWATSGAWVEFCHGGRTWRAFVSPVNHAEESHSMVADLQRRGAASSIVKALNALPSCRDRLERFSESCAKCTPVEETT